jgi:hypothetical protein
LYKSSVKLTKFVFRGNQKISKSLKPNMKNGI